MSLGNDVYGLQIQQQQAMQSQLAGNPVVPKEFSVQDRLGQTLNALTQCGSILDSIENSVQPEQPGGPPLGLIGASIACNETAERLVKRLIQLRERLGTL